MSKPHLEAVGDAYRFAWSDDQIVVEVDRLREESRGGLTGEITVKSGRPPSPGLLHRATFNLSSTQARRTLARTLDERDQSLDWAGMLEQLCFMALERWREGEPLIDLRTVNPGDRPRWLVQPYIEYGGPTVLFADGGTGKSLFALALAVSVATGVAVVADGPAECGAVMYLDWETDEYTHRERLGAILAGKGLSLDDAAPIYYRRETASLKASAPMLRRKVVDFGIRLVIVDSMGAARGDDPKEAGTTIQTFNAARSLGVPVIFVDHVTKEDGRDGKKPFGSAYTHNMARLTWGMVKAQDAGEDKTSIVLSNHKSNNGRLWSRRGYDVHFASDDEGDLQLVGFSPCDPRDVPDLAGALSRREQIEAVLRANNMALTVDDIVTALEADGIIVTAGLVRAILSRHKTRFVQVMGRPPKWGLLARDEAIG